MSEDTTASTTQGARCGRIGPDGLGTLEGKCPTCHIGAMFCCSGFWMNLFEDRADAATETSIVPVPDCGCRSCNHERESNALTRTFVVCSHCGNKRCPKADNHLYACSGSNEPGQTPVPEGWQPIELPPMKPDQIAYLRDIQDKLNVSNAALDQRIGPASRKPWALPVVAEVLPCSWAGGNDTCYCRTCGEEYRYGREDKPGCPRV